jgi:hypothetical protein
MLSSNQNNLISAILFSYANNNTLETGPYFICVLKSVDCPQVEYIFPSLMQNNYKLIRVK